MPSEITAETLADRVERDDDLLIVDTRTRPEYDLGHIPDSVNVPMNDLTDRIGDLDIPETVVVICEVGALAKQAARLIEAYEGVDSDVDVCYLAGGFREWSGAIQESEMLER